MKTRITIGVVIAALMGITGFFRLSSSHSEKSMTALQLANAEALTSGESGGYGCGYAAYEWDNDWYEDTKNFTQCLSGCPEKSGTSPKYINCW